MGNPERGKKAEKAGLSRHTDDGGAGAPLENISSLFPGIRKTRQPMHYDCNHHRRRPRRDHGGERTGGRRQKKSRHHRRQTLGRHVPELRLHPHQDAPRRDGPLGLLKAQERLRTMKGSIDIDYKALQTRVGRFLKGSSQTLAKSLAAAGIALYEGRGVCAGKGQVIVRSEAGEEMLTTDNIILSCGSSSASFPGLAPDGDAVLDSTGVLNLPEVPESLIIVGAGAIGLELGDFFGMMGSKITIVEAAPHIAPTEDADIAKEMDRVQSKAGRTCITGVMAKSLVTKDGQAELTLGDGRVLTASKALVAVGRTPNTAGLDCEKAGCTLKRRGFVDVNDYLEAAEGIYAIGDVNGLTLLAHAADHQGAYVARRILGHEKGVYVPGPVPSCIYGSTEIMRVGQTAKGLLAAGGAVSVSQVPLTLNPIAQAAGASGGFVKVVWDGDAIAGIAAIGHGVSHLVTVAQLLMVGGYTPERLHEVMIGHPTLDEIVPAAIRAPRAIVTE